MRGALRPKLLSPCHVTLLSEMVSDTAERLCFSSAMYQEMIHQKLAKLGLTQEPSLSWTKRFLQGIGLSYKQAGHDKLSLHDIEQQRENIENLAMKITWFRCTYGIDAAHIVNVDVTAVRLLLSGHNSRDRSECVNVMGYFFSGHTARDRNECVNVTGYYLVATIRVIGVNV